MPFCDFVHLEPPKIRTLDMEESDLSLRDSHKKNLDVMFSREAGKK